MFAEYWDAFVTHSSTIGTIVSILGFIITIFYIVKIKKVAIIARKASEATLRKLSYIDVVKELSATIEIAEEIKTLIVLKAWHLLPDRLSYFRRRIIIIRHIDDWVIKSHGIDLQSIIGYTAIAEKSLSKFITSGETEPKKIEKLTNRIIDQSTLLQNIQGRV